jgi:hypothetical protein
MHTRGILLRTGLLLAMLVTGNELAQAQETAACDQFAWSLSQERAWFGASALPVLQSGSTSSIFPAGAFVLTLLPAEDASFALPPGGKAKGASGFGGSISFTAIAAGLYQITLSEEGWIDVIQDGRALPSQAHTGKRDCPGVRKSVRFQINAAPTTIQLSRVASSTMKVVIRRAD